MPAGTRSQLYIAPAVDLHIIDVPALRPGEESYPGVYVAARTGSKAQGTGIDDIGGTTTGQRVQADPPIQVYLSRDGGTTFELAATLTAHCTAGFLMATENDFLNGISAEGISGATLVDDGSQLSVSWDRLSEMPILWYDEFAPTSTTEELVQLGENRMVVGDEVVEFATISTNPLSADFGSTDETASGVYWHSDLTRGRRGTENEIANRTSGDRVVLVNDAVQQVLLRPADINKTLVWRAVTFGGDVTEAEDVSMTFLAKNVTPFAPTNVRGVRDSGNDLTISWDRRTRSEVRLLGTLAHPKGEDRDDYIVEILSEPLPRTVLRTITATGATSVTYTAAQQTADGYTPGALIYCRVRQISNLVNWGTAGEWKIPANAGGAGTPTPSATLYAERQD